MGHTADVILAVALWNLCNIVDLLWVPPRVYGWRKLHQPPADERLKSKPEEALQSLVVTTCGQLWVGFVGCTLCGDATGCSPLAWRLTEPMFTSGHSKGRCFDLYFALIVVWIHTPRARINCFSLPLSQCVWNFCNKVNCLKSAILFDLFVAFSRLCRLVYSMFHVLSTRDSFANIQNM